jgi:hypothetical protein
MSCSNAGTRSTHYNFLAKDILWYNGNITHKPCYDMLQNQIDNTPEPAKGYLVAFMHIGDYWKVIYYLHLFKGLNKR